MSDCFIRRSVVQKLTALSATTIYELIRAGKFPKPVQLGPRAVGWRESEVLGWMKSRPVGTRS